jgi:ketosteroid isomerase-like protein
MRIILLIVALVANASVPHRLQANPNRNTTEELRAIEQRLAKAWLSGDRDYINGILDDNWTVIDATGRVLNKRQVLKEAFEANERKIDSLQIDEVQVREFSGCAVVTGRTQATGRYKGSTMSVTLRFTDVFVRLAGRWKVVASQATLITQ